MVQNLQNKLCPKQLKATQGEFSDAGVEKQLQKMQDGAIQKPIIASEDNYIIDGHQMASSMEY